MQTKVYGLNITEFTSDEVLEKTGIANFQNDQLLESFLEWKDDLEFSFRHENNDRRDQICLQSSPISYAIYKRFYAHKKLTDLFHPSISKEFTPDQIMFWAEPAPISILFRLLVEDGYYHQKPMKLKEIYRVCV